VVAVLAPVEQEPRTVPFRASFVPGVGYAAAPDDSVKGFSIGFLSYMQDLEGLDLELVGSWADGRMEGAQISTFGNIAGEVDGAQLSTGINWSTGRGEGTQLSAGANVAGDDFVGFQGASGVNVVAGDLRGLQASCVNVVAGEASQGVQLSAGVNVANGFTGVQMSPLNVARNLDGLQLGVVNVGGDVGGVQIGVVNIAKTSNVSIAPINLIGDGLHRLDVWASESAIGTAALKFGSKNVYTLIGAGWVNPSQSYWTFGGGLGVHLVRDPFWLEIDGSAWSVAEGPFILPGVHAKLRSQVGLDIAPHFAPFAGLSMNTWTGFGDVTPRALGVPSARRASGRFTVWPGFHAGVSF
jgi:hypothetical protein